MLTGGASLAYGAFRTYYTPMCSYCGSPMPADRSPGFGEVCEQCNKDLHACLNCRFYKSGARWDCAEIVEAPVSDKERRNFCEWYQTSPALIVRTKGREGAQSAAQKARDDLERLFGN